MRTRRDVQVHADVLVIERGDRLLLDAAGGNRRERRDRYGNALAESRLRRHSLGGPELRIRQRARARVALQKPVIKSWFFNETAAAEIYTLSLHDAPANRGNRH